MITVVAWKWGERYTAAHVNALAAMVRSHYDRPHRFVCVTDDPVGLGDGIEDVPYVNLFPQLQSPHGPHMPSCYARLIAWAPEARELFGERMVLIDLDVVLLRTVAPLWDRPEDVVLYRDPYRPEQANGSMVLLRAGARPDVLADFDPARSPQLAKARGFRGSDQAWLSYKLPDAPRWDTFDGVYSYKAHVRGKGLPADARMVVFHGDPKPWNVSEHWACEPFHLPA